MVRILSIFLCFIIYSLLFLIFLPKHGILFFYYEKVEPEMVINHFRL